MSALHHELLLLGLLDERRMHGYELHQLLEHRLHFVTDLKKPAAYPLLEHLHQRGLVERSTEHHGRRTERLVYRPTPAGLARFELLPQEQLGSADRVAYPGNVAVLFCDRLEPGERAALLRRRREAVARQREETAAFRQAHSAGSPAWLVLEHELEHAEAELRWLDATLAGLEGQGDEPSHNPKSVRERPFVISPLGFASRDVGWFVGLWRCSTTDSRFVTREAREWL